jgi:molybdopterin biosynthesis enzyme
MVAYPEQGQRIARLTPLADALAAVDALVKPVDPHESGVGLAMGRTLAANAVPAGARPQAALALRDGWAILSEETADAGSYAPAPLSAIPPRVDCGEPLPPGTDAVAPLDAVSVEGERAEALMPIAPGDGVLPAGGDAQPGKPLRRAGQRLRSLDCVALTAAGIAGVIIREPHIRLVSARPAGSAVDDVCYAWLADAIAGDGGAVIPDAIAEANPLEAALHHEGSDAVIVLGGTGSGSADVSVATLARAGRLEFHGVSLSPGETTAFGFIGARPVLLIPDRIDAALAAWLVIGRRWLARLSGRSEQETPVTAALSRKVVSALGMAEVVPVMLDDDAATPLASGYLSLASLSGADGWVLVPAESEGYPAGTRVAVRPLR